MEVQFTEFENAAYSIFIVLVTRVLLSLRFIKYILVILKVIQGLLVTFEIFQKFTENIVYTIAFPV